MRRLTAVAVGLILAACSAPEASVNVEESNYLNYSQRDDKWTGGVKVIPVETELGTFNVWTKRVGNNPDMKVLLLHGGPGATHEYFESADSYFPNAEVEYYYYDQLGSGNSDNPEQSKVEIRPRPLPTHIVVHICSDIPVIHNHDVEQSNNRSWEVIKIHQVKERVYLGWVVYLFT